MKEHKNDSTDALARFGRDKRVRTATVTAERVERSPRPQRDAADSERPTTDRQPRKRASYNPNFTADNRPLHEEQQGRSYGERPHYGEKEHSGRGFQGRGGAARGGESRRGQYATRDRDERHETRGRYERYERRDRREEQYGYYDEEPREEYGHAPHKPNKRYDNNRAEGRSASAYGERKAPRKYGERPSYDGRREERGGRFSSERRGERSSYPRFDAAKGSGEIRLNRFIAQSGLCSRREADDYIQAGVVTVNGQVVTELGSKVKPTDDVRFNGERVQGEKKVYLVLNKPKGYVTTMEDPHTDKTVMELVKGACTERIYPVGRLDKNSVGLLLFTNDGDLTKQLTHPSYRKKKIYQVTLDKPLTRADMDAIAEGITLEDGEIYADEISYVSENKEEVGIEIHSGRNRIVRRIFEHLGYTVLKLDRVYYAGLTKKNLKRGQWRFLTREEVERLKSGQYE
uniref:pseudouridine synthase n=1 Tax=Alistipes sp. Marseille-P5061 TaxID=2048242 RepID=UPI000D10CF2F|nr:pseudouridine synthase [Alistipes sp. Marseille-P5061]